MKTKILIALTSLLLFGCQTGPNTAQITAAVSLGTSTALGLVTDKAKQTAIANYIDVGATAVRSIPDTGTVEQLTDAINKAMPDSVKTEFPTLLPHIIPVVVSMYQVTHNLNAIAAGLEEGAAPYITKK